jgi:hypothetical protein
MTKPHNIASITAEPDPEGVTFTLRVKLIGGGELVINGPEAIPAFYTISNAATEQYDDENEKETLH